MRALVAEDDAVPELYRGRFPGAADDVVVFEAKGLDAALEAFRKAVDDYLLNETADLLLRRLVAYDPSQGKWEQQKKRYLVAIYSEMADIEAGEPVDALLQRIERLSFIMASKLQRKDPAKIIAVIEEAAARGIQRAYKRPRRKEGSKKPHTNGRKIE
jgi:hypothetical protein